MLRILKISNIRQIFFQCLNRCSSQNGQKNKNIPHYAWLFQNYNPNNYLLIKRSQIRQNIKPQKIGPILSKIHINVKTATIDKKLKFQKVHCILIKHLIDHNYDQFLEQTSFLVKHIIKYRKDFKFSQLYQEGVLVDLVQIFTVYQRHQTLNNKQNSKFFLQLLMDNILFSKRFYKIIKLDQQYIYNQNHLKDGIKISLLYKKNHQSKYQQNLNTEKYPVKLFALINRFDQSISKNGKKEYAQHTRQYEQKFIQFLKMNKQQLRDILNKQKKQIQNVKISRLDCLICLQYIFASDLYHRFFLKQSQRFIYSTINLYQSQSFNKNSANLLFQVILIIRILQSVYSNFHRQQVQDLFSKKTLKKIAGQYLKLYFQILSQSTSTFLSEVLNHQYQIFQKYYITKSFMFQNQQQFEEQIFQQIIQDQIPQEKNLQQKPQILSLEKMKTIYRQIIRRLFDFNSNGITILENTQLNFIFQIIFTVFDQQDNFFIKQTIKNYQYYMLIKNKSICHAVKQNRMPFIVCHRYGIKSQILSKNLEQKIKNRQNLVSYKDQIQGSNLFFKLKRYSFNPDPFEALMDIYLYLNIVPEKGLNQQIFTQYEDQFCKIIRNLTIQNCIKRQYQLIEKAKFSLFTVNNQFSFSDTQIIDTNQHYKLFRLNKLLTFLKKMISISKNKSSQQYLKDKKLINQILVDLSQQIKDKVDKFVIFPNLLVNLRSIITQIEFSQPLVINQIDRQIKNIRYFIHKERTQLKNPYELFYYCQFFDQIQSNNMRPIHYQKVYNIGCFKKLLDSHQIDKTSLKELKEFRRSLEKLKKQTTKLNDQIFLKKIKIRPILLKHIERKSRQLKDKSSFLKSKEKPQNNQTTENFLQNYSIQLNKSNKRQTSSQKYVYPLLKQHKKNIARQQKNQNSQIKNKISSQNNQKVLESLQTQNNEPQFENDQKQIEKDYKKQYQNSRETPPFLKKHVKSISRSLNKKNSQPRLQKPLLKKQIILKISKTERIQRYIQADQLQPKKIFERQKKQRKEDKPFLKNSVKHKTRPISKRNPLLRPKKAFFTNQVIEEKLYKNNSQNKQKKQDINKL